MGKQLMRSAAASFIVSAMLLSAGGLPAQVAGSSTFGVNVEAMNAVAIGWSAKKKILGKPVYNDKNEKIGMVDDLIVTTETSLSYGIIGASEFLDDVAIPVGQSRNTRDGSSWRARSRTR